MKRGKRTADAQSPLSLQGLGAMFKGRAQGSLKRTLKCCHCCHQGLYKNPSSTVILNVQSGQTVLVKNQKPVGRANTNLKTGNISSLGGGGAGGRWCRQGRSIQQMVYITMTGSLESLPSSTAAPAQRGQTRGKEESQTLTGHAGLEAAGWECSNKPPSFFVVF